MKALRLTEEQLIGLRIAAKLADERHEESQKAERAAGEALRAAADGEAVDWKNACQRKDDARADELAALRILRVRLAEAGLEPAR